MTTFSKSKMHLFPNDMQDLRPCKNCHVLYQTQVKHKHYEHDDLWYKKKSWWITEQLSWSQENYETM